MAATTGKHFVTHEEVLRRELLDEEFRREWERTAFARDVAARVIAYRARHDLTQAQLAKRLGMAQPQVARLEIGEHNPSHATLARLAGRLGMEFAISVAPAERESRLVGKRARDAEVARVERDGAVLRFSIG